jgi:molybdopterin molybdotransferase
MLSVEEALDQILSRVDVLGTERVDLLSALDRILAEPIIAYRNLPPWACSSMDGYAVRSDDTAAASAERPVDLEVAGRIPAGSLASRALGPGEAFRIFTGAPLPEGADAVIPQEEVEALGGGPEAGREMENTQVRIRRRVRRGEAVRPLGEDVREGETLLEPGHRIGSAEIGLLASLGHSRVQVYRRPRVAILATGDEVVDLGGELTPGKIHNSNSYSLMAQVVEAGGVPVNLGIATDRPEAVEERLQGGLSAAEVLISSAGVSVGDYDVVQMALSRLGAQLHLWKVSMRPGKPVMFASLSGRPFFGLPGNPVSAMVTFELFVRPALRKMMGDHRLFRERIVAKAATAIPNPGHRRGYLRVTLEPRADGYWASLTGDQGSGILRSMTLADGLAVVAPDTTIPVGGEVTVIVLRSPASNSQGA